MKSPPLPASKPSASLNDLNEDYDHRNNEEGVDEPPIVYELTSPSAQSTMSTTAIVHHMRSSSFHVKLVELLLNGFLRA